MTHVPRFNAFQPGSLPEPGPALVSTAAVTTPANIAAGICVMEATSEGFRSPLLRTVARDEVALSCIQPGQTPPLRRLDHTGRPSVLVLMADDDAAQIGPDEFPYAARAMRWAYKALIHASGGTPEHYELAVVAAQNARRLILIETGTAHAEAWMRMALRSMPPGRILLIHPPKGGIHPVPVPRETVQ